MYDYEQPWVQPQVAQSRVLWYSRPTTLLIFGVAAAVLLFVPSEEYRSAVLMAAFNFGVICFAFIRLLNHHRVSSLVPCLFLAWFALGWPLGTVIFGLLEPNMHYDIAAGRRYMMEGNLRLQFAMFVFIATYLTVFLAFRPRGARNVPLDRDPPNARPMLRAVVPLCLGLSCVLAFLSFFGGGNILSYVGFGAYKYVIGLYLVLGALVLSLRTPTKLFLAAILGCVGFVFVLKNSRGFAATPIVLIFGGFLFLSGAKQKTKTTALLIAMIGMPTLLVIGNTVRTVLGHADASLATRLQALGQWEEVLGRSSVALSTFGRLFSTGGHAIVTESPEHVPYLDFSLAGYTLETLVPIFIPERFITWGHYSNPMLLRSYGFRIIEGGHSVELSMIGSFWMLGGYLAVFAGAVFVAFLHLGLAHWIASAANRSRLKGLFYLSAISYQLLWGHNIAFSSHVKVLIWSAGIAILIYHCYVKVVAPVENPVPEYPPGGLAFLPHSGYTPTWPSAMPRHQSQMENL